MHDFNATSVTEYHFLHCAASGDELRRANEKNKTNKMPSFNIVCVISSRVLHRPKVKKRVLEVRSGPVQQPFFCRGVHHPVRPNRLLICIGFVFLMRAALAGHGPHKGQF
jgi:hypothetical protein